MLELKTQILANERALLQTLDFDLVVKHPPEYLFQFAKSLKLEFGEKIPNQLVQVRPTMKVSPARHVDMLVRILVWQHVSSARFPTSYH